MGLAKLDAKDSTPAEVGEWAKSTGDYISTAKAAQWANTSAASAELAPLVGYPKSKAAQLTNEFRSWAKANSLDELRETAKAMGMDPQGASRAQLQNWVAASWDPTLSKVEIRAAAAAKTNPTAPGKPLPAPTVPKAVTATSAPLSSGPAVSVGPRPPGSFTGKHQGIVAALKAHQSLTADLPPRPTPAEVEAWSFGPGQSAALGGAHQKTLHAAPDGSMWLFKPDFTGGARAEAEATASQVYHWVGIPSVGVYARSIGGKAGYIQPIVSGPPTSPPTPRLGRKPTSTPWCGSTWPPGGWGTTMPKAEGEPMILRPRCALPNPCSCATVTELSR